MYGYNPGPAILFFGAATLVVLGVFIGGVVTECSPPSQRMRERVLQEYKCTGIGGDFRDGTCFEKARELKP